ncbi:MAG: ABC transporter permease [Ignavibacteria bacterium]|nr:MAG: ABC transporter permease [Ignavibacteria bacterium]
MRIVYVIREGFSGFRRAKLSALGSVLTITIALLLLGVFYVVSMNASRIVEGIRQRVEMEAFLAEPVARAQIDEIQARLLVTEGVERVQFVSKDDAAKIFKQEFGEEIGKVLEFNPLPPSFKIFLKDGFRTTEKADALQKKISGIPGIADVVYRRQMLEFIDRQTKTLYAIGLGIGVVIAISAIFLVSNTIRLTIYAKRKAVQTMKLVGASRWIVRAPFLIEGVVQGMIGGAAAALTIYYLISIAAGLVSPDLAEFIRIDPLFYPQLVLVGMILGFFGSAISIRKFIGDTVLP